MSKLPLPSNLPLKVRGMKGGYFHSFHNSPCPSYLKRGIRENFLKRENIGKIDEIRVLRWQNRLVLWILGFDIV